MVTLRLINASADEGHDAVTEFSYVVHPAIKSIVGIKKASTYNNNILKIN